MDIYMYIRMWVIRLIKISNLGSVNLMHFYVSVACRERVKINNTDFVYCGIAVRFFLNTYTPITATITCYPSLLCLIISVTKYMLLFVDDVFIFL